MQTSMAMTARRWLWQQSRAACWCFRGPLIRGSAIEGGQPRMLVKGDVMVIPNGVPHWFENVQAPFLYYVVKATAPAGGDR